MSGFPSPNYGANIAVGVVLSGTGIVDGVGPFEYVLKAAYQSTTTVTATVVDSDGNPLSPQPALTVTSTNGAPTESGEASEFTAFPVGGGGAQYNGVRNDYNNPAGNVVGIGANSNVASVTGTATATATVTINNTGRALIEWSTPDGRTGRLSVTGQNPLV